MGKSALRPQDSPVKIESLQNQVCVSVPDRKTRSLFRWISRVTGVDACWIEGIDADDNPLWGIAKKLTRRLWYIVSRRLKPAIALTALGGALLIPVQALQAQTSRELSTLNGANGFLAAGESGNSGLAVAAGDFNNDGIEDLVVGAFAASTNDGKTYVVFGKNSGFDATLDLSSLSGSNGYVLNGVDNESTNSGRAVAAGDINGDGVDDVIIGAPKAKNSGTYNSGDTFVVFGDELANADAADASSDGSIELANLNGTTGFVLNGKSGDHDTGRAVASGDINGDNIDDIIIGAYSASSNTGETYVVFGKSTGFNSSIDISALSTSEGFTLNGIDTNDYSGQAVAAGDIDGDGNEDVIIGAKLADPNTNSASGETYVVFGDELANADAADASSDGSIELANLNGTTGFVLNGVAAEDESGRAVSSGDIDGDGIDDVIIGGFHADPNGSDTGETYVVFGKSTGFSASMELSGLMGGDGFVLNGIDSYDESGYSVSSGDINGDGADDVIIGALLADPNGNYSGETYVVFGGSDVGSGGTIELSALSGNDGFVLNGIDSGDFSGRGTSAGDINGDGADDVIVGATGAASSAGETYVFFNTTFQTITGNEGFRLLSAPVSGTVFDELLGKFWTQGFTNADAGDSFDDNVWVWDETLNTNSTPDSGDWVSLTDLNTDNLAAGTGFLFYIYSDDDADGTPEGFPKLITIGEFGDDGTGNSGTINPFGSLGDGRFFLAGNPYKETIDWDAGTGWTKTNLSNTFYIWSDSADAGAGAWLDWNGTTGTKPDSGLVASYQGFFVQASGGTGALSMTEDVISDSTGTFYKQAGSEPLVLELELEGDGLKNSAFLQFDERAVAGRDRYDGLELQPLSNNYLQLFSATGDGTSLNINALPGEGTFEIPLRMLRVEEGVSTDADATLRWNGLDKFPAGWRFLLVDTRTGEEINLNLTNEQRVSISAGSRDKAFGQELKVPLPVMQSADGDPRYVLKVTAGETAGPADLPASVALKQNYPNPFNPATVIRFELPEARNVSLEVFDLSGRKIATLLDGRQTAGFHQVQWAPENLASGLYLYKLQAGRRVITRKMMLIK